MLNNGISGRLDGRIHHLPLRIHYVDTDAGGVVYHAAYLAFAERARTEMMRAAGIDLLALSKEKQLVFSVRRCDIDFQRPARLDDLIDVRTELVRMGGASLDAEQTVYRGDTELVRINIRLACTHLAFKAARIPDSLRATLRDFVKETD